jgi:hypothetical protein
MLIGRPPSALRRDRFTLVRPAPQPEVEIRCRADYDAATRHQRRRVLLVEQVL